jgi:hypothetical protein
MLANAIFLPFVLVIFLSIGQSSTIYIQNLENLWMDVYFYVYIVWNRIELNCITFIVQ